MRYDKGRNRGKVSTETSLCLEALAKLRLGEGLAEFGNDATADINAAARTEGKRQIAGNGSEHRAEHPERLDAERILFTDRQIGDLRRGIAAGWRTVELRQRTVRLTRPGPDRTRSADTWSK